jgi:hypothetical protein
MEIFNSLYQLDAYAIINNVFLIGGWNNVNYMTLRNQINIMREHCAMIMKQNRTSSPKNFDLFVSTIKLNLIGFNLPVKKSDGKNKGENDDDSPNDYACDCTIVYDRSSTPHTFVICQYAGREYRMSSARSDSLLQAIYEIDPTSKHLQAFICSSASKLPYYDEFLDQLLLNVNDSSLIYHSFDNDT